MDSKGAVALKIAIDEGEIEPHMVEMSLSGVCCH